MTRRRAAIAVALCIALAACTGNAPTPRPSPTASAQPTAAAGEIRVAYPWEPPTLNPFLSENPATRELVAPMLPPLFRSLPGGKSEPHLVKSIESETSSAVTLVLRDDATWSDGKPITSSDVAFTHRTILDRRWPITSRASYEAVTVEAPTPARLVLRFTRPVPAWRSLFSDGLGVLPEHALRDADFGKALGQSWPVSGGPYVLTHYTRGLELVYEASPHAWGTAPSVRQIRVQFVPDATTAVQMFRKGKVDILGPYSSGDFARRAAELPDATLTTDTGASRVDVRFASSGIMADARVRDAFAAATDRPALIDGLVRAEGTRLDHPVGFDPNRAGALLREAGYTASRRPSITFTSVGSDDLAARLSRGLYYQLKEAGFEVNLVEMEYEQLWRDWLPSGRMQAALVRATGAPASPHIPLYRASVSAVASARVSGVKASATADGFLAFAAEWKLGR